MSLVLNTLTIVSGQPVTVTAGTATQPAGTNPALTNEERNAGLDALLALCNGGTLQVYTAAFGTLLAQFTLNNPCYGAASAGSAALNVTGMTVNASASGTAAVYRFRTSGAANRRTGTVSL